MVIIFLQIKLIIFLWIYKIVEFLSRRKKTYYYNMYYKFLSLKRVYFKLFYEIKNKKIYT